MAVGAGVAKKGLGGLLATAFSTKNIIAGLFVLVAGGAYMAWSRMTEEAEESAKGLARVGKATEDATLALQNMKGMTSGLLAWCPTSWKKGWQQWRLGLIC